MYLKIKILIITTVLLTVSASKEKMNISLSLEMNHLIFIFSEDDYHLKAVLKSKRLSQKDPGNSVKQFIQRIIGDKADQDDFIINFNKTLNSDDLDTFEV